MAVSLHDLTLACRIFDAVRQSGANGDPSWDVAAIGKLIAAYQRGVRTEEGLMQIVISAGYNAQRHAAVSLSTIKPCLSANWLLDDQHEADNILLYH